MLSRWEGKLRPPTQGPAKAWHPTGMTFPGRQKRSITMEQPVIVCGLGQVGWRVLEYLRAAGLCVIAIDDRWQPTDPRLGKARLIRGDYRQREVLDEAGLAQARGVLIL